MATIIEAPLRKSKKKTGAVKIDMTPMVDLGFLLITFFIFTTSMMEPHVTKLMMPTESDDSMPVQKKTLLTAILGKGKVVVYEGAWNDALVSNSLHQSNYNLQTGLGFYVREKQKDLGAQKEDMMVVIKPLPSSSYQELLNALDEMTINGVKRYAVIDADTAEKEVVTKMN